jgi:Spy/CpxP family protein refolding chaperone
MMGTLAVGVGQAQQRGRGGPGFGRPAPMMPGPAGMIRLHLGPLNLTDQQREQVRSILANHKADFQGLNQRAEPARKAMDEAIVAGDEAAIRQRGAELGAIQTDRALLAARVRAEVFKVLTPEQQQKAQTLREGVQRRMQPRGRQGRGTRN